jgi:hypothetical protein
MPDPSQVSSNKIYFDLIHLGAIKLRVTLRLEKKAFELDISDPMKGFGAMNIGYSMFAGVASISNSSLSFKELVMVDSCQPISALVQVIVKNYARQGVLQVYKLLGSSDMIGNPMNLVDKLGTGVFEFASEPVKGLLKGPEEFVGGIGKGVSSLVSNVVSGGMDSVSKITGSLYTVVKNVQGTKDMKATQATGVFDGAYQGVKGGVGELLGGVTGIFSKPVARAK